MSYKEPEVYGPHGQALGDCWSVVNYFINLGIEKNEIIELSLYLYKGKIKKRSDKMAEILPLLEHSNMVKLVEKDPTVQKIHWSCGYKYPFVSTIEKWKPNKSGRICYQFDGRSRKGQKNFKTLEIENDVLHGMKDMGYELIKLGCEMSLSDCVKEASLCEIFVGIDSGMCHLAASVGIPIFFCQNQSPLKIWETNHSNKHFILASDNNVLIENIREYKENGLRYYVKNASNISLFIKGK